MLWFGAVLVAALVAAAAVLAMAETSLTHLGQARVRALEEEGWRGAEALGRLLEHRVRSLNPLLLLLLTCHLGAATVVAVLAYERSGAGGVAVAFAVELAVIFVVAEAIPKTYALQRSDRAATRVAPLIGVLTRFPPLRWIAAGLVRPPTTALPGPRREGPSVPEEELLPLAGVAADAEVIDSGERALIASIIDFGDTITREVMVPRPDMVSVGGHFRVGDVMEVVLLNGYSRIPVCGEGIDDVVGIAYAKDLMRADRDGHADREVSSLVRGARFVPETKRVAELLPEMQAEQFHMAIVIDEYGATAGLVTLEDLIEELVGEIVDEFDVEDPMVEPLPGGEVRVDARLAIDEANDLMGVELPEGDWDTVGGLLLDLLGHPPGPGEGADVGAHRLTAERVQGRRISRLRISGRVEERA